MSVDRLEVVPVAVVGGYLTVIELPSFVKTDLTWKGASEKVLQFNFTNTIKFFLTQLPVKPSGANFVLCIRYRVGSEVYRYKLWDDEDCVLDVPLYNKEIIRPNFVLEVWSISSSTSVNNLRPLYLYTNRTVLPENAIDDYIYKFPSGTEVDLNSGINIPIASFNPGVEFSHYVGNFTNGVPESTPTYYHTEVQDIKKDNALYTNGGNVYEGLFSTAKNRAFLLTNTGNPYTNSYAPQFMKGIFGFFVSPTADITTAFIPYWFSFNSGSMHVTARSIDVSIAIPANHSIMYIMKHNLTSVSIYVYDITDSAVLYNNLVYTDFAENTYINYQITTSDSMTFELYLYEHGFFYTAPTMTMEELAAEYLQYIQKYYFFTINGLNWDNAAVAWLDNTEEDLAYVSIDAIASTATTQRLNVFNELYVKDSASGNYYMSTMIIVDGVPTLRIDPNPITI